MMRCNLGQVTPTAEANVIVPLIVSCWLATGAVAAPASPIPPGAQKPLYFPVTVGSKWVYSHEGGREYSAKVTAVERKGGKTIVSIESTLLPPGDVLVSEGGLELVRFGDLDGKMPERWLNLPTKPDDSWGIPSPDNGFLFDPGIARTVCEERVDVPAGAFTAVRVEARYPHKRARPADDLRVTVITTWYAPDVGVVKQTITVPNSRVSTVVLKSFTPGPK